MTTQTAETQKPEYRLLSVHTMAERCGVSTNTMLRVVCEPSFPRAVTIGPRNRRWRPEDVQKLEERNKK